MEIKKEYTAGAVQFNIANGRIETNMEKVMESLLALADRGVSLAVLPELFSCGFDNERIKDHALKTPALLERLSGFAAASGMAVSGSLPEASGNRVFNTLYFIDGDGKIKGAYRKLHLFPLTLEHEYYASGDQIVVVDTNMGKIGLMICYDLRFPEQARQMFRADAELILVSAQWPKPRIAHWQVLARARAVENQLFMVCANRTGTDQDLVFSGGTMIVDPMGEVLAKADETQPFVAAQIDLNQVEQARQLIPCRIDRRGDVYG